MRPTALCFLAVLTAACSSPASTSADGAAGDATLDAGLDAQNAGDAAVVDAAPDVVWNLPADAGPTAWSGFPACDTAATTQALTFVHVNDLHAGYVPDEQGISRWARIRGYMESVRATQPFTVFTDGGDDFEKGSVAELLSEGVSTREILRAMRFDVRVIGNHDFAWSLDEVLADTRDPFSAVLLSNMTYRGSDASRFGARDWVVKQVGCLRVGFAGMVSTPWDERDRTIDEPFYPELPATYDYVTRARELVTAHRGEVDVLVFVNHIGLSGDEDLARRVPGIDVILSGHSHSTTNTIDRVGTTRIVQAGWAAQAVIRLDLTVDLRTHAVTGDAMRLSTTGALPPDPYVHRIVREMYARYAPDASVPVGRMKNLLGTEPAARLAARAVREQLQVDAALVDRGTLWGPLVPGPVTAQSFVDTFRVERERPGTPGFNSFYRTTVTGAALQRLRSNLGATWSLDVGPTTLDAGTVYTLALQKRPAYHPDEYLPSGVTLAGPITFVAETWSILTEWSRGRTARCLYVDTDDRRTDLASCTQ